MSRARGPDGVRSGSYRAGVAAHSLPTVTDQGQGLRFPAQLSADSGPVMGSWGRRGE